MVCINAKLRVRTLWCPTQHSSLPLFRRAADLSHMLNSLRSGQLSVRQLLRTSYTASRCHIRRLQQAYAAQQLPLEVPVLAVMWWLQLVPVSTAAVHWPVTLHMSVACRGGLLRCKAILGACGQAGLSNVHVNRRGSEEAPARSSPAVLAAGQRHSSHVQLPVLSCCA